MPVLFSDMLYPLENKTSIEYIKYFKDKITSSFDYHQKQGNGFMI